MCFFFFKQKTAYEMRISDWSSDVCSSDLRWYEYTGIMLGEAHKLGSLIHPDHLERFTTRSKAGFHSGKPWEDTVPIRRYDGEWRWFLSHAVPVLNQDGDIVRWLGTNTDITEQKESEQHHKRLMREVDHRAKNALAVPQAIVSLSRSEEHT